MRSRCSPPTAAGWCGPRTATARSPEKPTSSWPTGSTVRDRASFPEDRPRPAPAPAPAPARDAGQDAARGGRELGQGHPHRPGDLEHPALLLDRGVTLSLGEPG